MPIATKIIMEKHKKANHGLPESFTSSKRGKRIFTVAKAIQLQAPPTDTRWGCKISDIISQVIGPILIPPAVRRAMMSTHINKRGKNGLF